MTVPGFGSLALAATSAVLAATPAGAAPGQPGVIVSGVYDEAMLIAVDPATHELTGYFRMEGSPPGFSCIFFLTGTLNGGAARIATYFPATPADDRIDGALTIETPQRFAVNLPREHGGCWNVEHFADKDLPAEFTLQAAHPWRAIAVVRSDKAYFFDSPASATHRRGYLVKGDGVGVRAAQGGWLQVDYPGDTLTSGWIRQSDVYPPG